MRPTCISRIQNSRLFGKTFHYEHAKYINRFLVRFKDPVVHQEYKKYVGVKTQEKLNYMIIFLLLFTLVELSLMAFGSSEMIPVRLGRAAINLVGGLSAFLLHSRWEYATLTIMAFWLISTGAFNTLVLPSTGPEVTSTGLSCELIGSDNTTIIYILVMFMNGNCKYGMTLFTPIYMLVNVAMFNRVYDEERQEHAIQGVNEAIRVCLISFILIFVHYLVVLQGAELFLKNSIIKLQ